MELDAEPLAQVRAMTLVGAGRFTQAVVAVQRGDVRATGDPDGEVEQADRVAAAREEHEHRPRRPQQPGRRHSLEQIH